MRNLGFWALLAVVLATGVYIGGSADLSMVRPSLGEKTRFTLPLFKTVSSNEMETPLPREAPSILQFDIDTTTGKSRDTPPSYPHSRGMSSPSTSSCRMPAAGENKLVVFSVYEGDALSTSALGSRDVETTTVDIEIEAGAEPLYLVLSAFDNMIWRFSGATNRVERVVLLAADSEQARPTTAREAERRASAAAGTSSRGRPSRSTALANRPFAGVVGLSSNIVTTRNPSDCFGYFTNPESIQATQTAAIVRRATGRAPDVIAAHYSLGAARLPSGKAAKGAWRGPAPEGFDQAMWGELLRFTPGGVSSITPEEVHSTVSIQSYDVLPQQAGLAQLIGSGQLVRLSDGLRIAKPIARFPAGLTGAHSVTFMLGTGIPMPAGNSGHSCVVSQETGQAVANDGLCRF